MKKQELEELKLSVYEKLSRAIDEGDKAKAKALAEEARQGKRILDTTYTTWIDYLLTYVSENLGEEKVHEIFKTLFAGAAGGLKASFGSDVPLEQKIKNRASNWTVIHGTHIDSIEEDEDKFIFRLKCPSGGEVRCRAKFGKTKKAYPWSWGIEGLAYYCVHHPVMDEVMIENLGYPGWVVHMEPEGYCVQWVYKNPEAVPEEYYKRVGMKKPKNKQPAKTYASKK